MWVRSLMGAAGLWLCALLAVPGLQAQRAALRVQVNDPAGARIEGATVEAWSLSGAALASAVTGPDGVAELESLPLGLCRLEVAAENLQTLERPVQVRAGGSAVTVELELATLSTTVEVEAAAAAPVAVQSADAAQLAEDPSTDLADSLRSIPGVNVLRRGGTNFEPLVSGLRETQVAMVVDGTRTFAAGPGRMDSELSHVEPGHLSQVDVFTGPYALAEGAGAFSAIVVRTPNVPRYDQLRLGATTSAGYGTNGANRFARARINGGDRRFGFSLRGAGNKGNDYLAGASGSGPAAAIPGDFSNHQFGGKLRFNPTEGQELSLGSLYDEQTGVDFPGRQLNAVHFILRAWNGAYLLRKPTEKIRAAKLGLYLNKKSHRMTNAGKPSAMDMPGRTPPFSLQVDLPTESDTAGGFGWVDVALSAGWSLRTGFDFYNLDQSARRTVARASNGLVLFADTVWPDASINDQGFYVQTTRSSERGEISGTLRFDTVQADAGRASEFYLANTTGSLDRSEINTSFSLAGRRRLARGLSAGAGFGRVVRTANALERYSDRFPSTKFQIAAEFMGNPAIGPETSWQADLNLEATRGDLSVSVGGFYRSVEDYITVAPDPSLPKRLPLSPPTVFRYLNGDRAVFRGYQFGATYAMFRMARLRVQGAKVIADDLEQSTPPIGRNEPVLGVPPLEMSTAMRIHDPGGRFWAEYRVRNVWDQRRVAASRLETGSPGFSLHGLRFGAELPGRLTLHIGVENLGDKLYFEHINSLNPFTRTRIPEQGRNLYGALTKAW